MSEQTLDRFEYEAYEYGQDQASSDDDDVFGRASANGDWVATGSLYEKRNRTILTAEQEVELATCIRAGQAAAERLQVADDSGANIADAERQELRRQITLADQARHTMIERNLGLVFKCAQGFAGRGVDKDDLVQAGIGGNIGSKGEPVDSGLIHAIEKFDPSLGYKFSTYASSWIKNAMQRYVQQQGSPIRVAYRESERIRMMTDMQSKAAAEDTAAPSLQDIADKLGVDTDEVKKLQRWKWQFSTGSVESLDATISSESNASVGDFIPDYSTDPSSEVHIDTMDLHRAIGNLSARKQVVVRMLFETKPDGTTPTEQDIAARIGYTVPAMRKDLNDALETLHELLAVNEDIDAATEPAVVVKEEAAGIPIAPPVIERPTLLTESGKFRTVAESIRLLSRQEEELLLEQMQGAALEEARELRNTLVLSYLRRVFRRSVQIESDPAIREDVMQSGFEALIRSIDRFAGKENRVSLMRYIDASIGPVMKTERRNEYYGHSAFDDRLTRASLASYQAEYANVTDERGVVHPPNIGAIIGVSAEESYALNRLVSNHLSLNRDVLDELAIQESDQQPDDASEIRTGSEADIVQLERALELLTPLERQLIVGRFGLDGDPPKTSGELDVLLGYKSGSAASASNLAIAKLREVMIAMQDGTLDYAAWPRLHSTCKNPLSYLAIVGKRIPDDMPMSEIRAMAMRHISSAEVDQKYKDVVINLYRLHRDGLDTMQKIADKYGMNNSTISRYEKRFFKELSKQ